MATGVECDAVTSMIQVCDALQIGIPNAELERTIASIMWNAQDDAEPISGAIELLQHASVREVPIAVVSSAAYHPFLEWSLDRSGMIKYVDRIVTSASCGIYKSDPAIYQYTLDMFQASGCTSLHVGDSPRFDVASASSVGMKTVLLTSDLDARFDPAPDLMVRSLGDVPKHWDKLLPV